jgi:hypothetical protein
VGGRGARRREGGLGGCWRRCARFNWAQVRLWPQGRRSWSCAACAGRVWRCGENAPGRLPCWRGASSAHSARALSRPSLTGCRARRGPGSGGAEPPAPKSSRIARATASQNVRSASSRRLPAAQLPAGERRGRQLRAGERRPRPGRICPARRWRSHSTAFSPPPSPPPSATQPPEYASAEDKPRYGEAYGQPVYGQPQGYNGQQNYGGYPPPPAGYPGAQVRGVAVQRTFTRYLIPQCSLSRPLLTSTPLCTPPTPARRAEATARRRPITILLLRASPSITSSSRSRARRGPICAQPVWPHFAAAV